MVARKLEDTSGWSDLSLGKQKTLKRTSELVKGRKMDGLEIVGTCVGLIEVEHALKGEEMTLTDYIRTVFGQSERTAWRRLADFKELRDHYWNDAIIEVVASKGAGLLQGSSGVGLKDLIAVAKVLPPPDSTEDIEGFIRDDVREMLRNIRKDRRAGRLGRHRSEDASKEALDALRLLLRASKLNTDGKKELLIRVVGWVMEDQKITGELCIRPGTVPDGLLTRKGRHPKKS